MKLYQGMAAGIAALTLALPVPAHANSIGRSGTGAEKLRKLDIMLMVTSLRCRTTADNFQADYAQFSANHLADLNAANRALKAELTAQYGSAGVDRALDRLSVVMANTYGQGHPWLDCHELKQVARSLADAHGMAPLEEAAAELLDGDHLAMRGH